MTEARLVFVYNAEQGFFNALTDSVHKVFSPNTYRCSLCKYTSGLTGMVLPWKFFIDSLRVPPVFLHRTEFKQSYPDFETDLPVIFFEQGEQRQVVLSAREIADTHGVDRLIPRVRKRLKEIEATSSS